MAYLWVGKAQSAQGLKDEAAASWQAGAALDPTGYYSVRANELLAGSAPFTSQDYELPGFDWAEEREKAESWLRVVFDLEPGTNLDGPGSLVSDPRYVRAMAFHELGLYPEARAEFETLREAVAQSAADSMRLLEPVLELGYYRTAVFASRQILDLARLDDAGTLTAPPYFNYIRFGTYYADQVTQAAEQEELDPFFLWSVIRQESLYEGHVISSAGAAGLMQIMPATGDEIASRLEWPPDYETSDLYRPIINIRLGASYLARQRNYFDGDLFAALAAYNGGPGNSSVWRDLANGDPDVFLEVIRFEETRRYIRSIYEFWRIYNIVYQPRVVDPYTE
jgi:soluble lytic murein transglycosylase